MVVDDLAPSDALNILLLEDSTDDAQLLVRRLRRMGSGARVERVHRESDYRAALRRSWDVVLADYSLPGFTGLDALRQLRSQDSDTPFILVSGRPTDDTIAQQALAEGAQDYVRKDDLTRLPASIQQAVDVARARTGTAVQPLPDGHLLTMMQMAEEGIVAVDQAQGIVFFNRGAETLFGYRAAEVLGKPLELLLPERFRAGHAGHVAGFGVAAESGRHMNQRRAVYAQRKDGSEFAAEASIIRHGDGKQRMYAVFLRDVSERIADEKRLRHLSRHDPLTGLPNRLGFLELLNDLLDAMRFREAGAAVFCINLDRFRLINESFGFELGDRLLCEIAGEIQGSLPRGAGIGRVGSNEFALVFPDVATFEQAQAFIHSRLEAHRRRPFVVDGQPFFLTSSIGVALFPEHGDSGEALLRAAESAQDAVKQAGGADHGVHVPRPPGLVAKQLTLTTELVGALDRHELVLHYQPQVDLRSGALHGLEALLRWQHPRRGLVPPGRFLDLLELTGLVVPVGRWVIDTALAQQRAWLDQGLGECTVAVNLSVRQFSDAGLVEAVDAALRHYAIAPSRLVLEITESMLIRNAGQAQKILHELHALGCQLAVDDFGTGYASLAYLQRFPAHYLKLDRSFVSRLETDAKSQAIVEGALAMARGLRITVIAEGIENAFERDYLRGLGCPYGQGYLFARPMAGDDATAYLRSRTQEGGLRPADR